MPTGSSEAEKFGDKLEELDLTSDEIRRLTEAMKKKEFRDLLAEYAKEIQDPENKKRYEEEIRMMESERGVDVKFITPTPGYVIKTVQNGDTKCFVNICHSNTIDKATCTKSPQNKGEHWSIPYSTAAGREDTDKAGGKCFVYDCVFHEETYNRGLKDARFRKLIHDTALQGIEGQLGVKLDKVNLKFPKLKFKGVVQPTMIRRKRDEETTSAIEGDKGSGDQKAALSASQSTTAAKSATSLSQELNESRDSSLSEEQKKVQDKLSFPYPYPVPNDDPGRSSEITSSSEDERQKQQQSAEKTRTKTSGVKVQVEDCLEIDGKMFTVPQYSLVHRGYSDMQSCVDMSDSKLHATRPKELVVQITLPLLSSAKTVSLDVLKKQLLLHSETPAAYHLDIALPYPVEEEKGSARFDKTKKKLIVTLPVLPPENNSAVSIPIEDQTSVSSNVDQSPQKTTALVEEIVDSDTNRKYEKTENSNDGQVAENDTAEKSPTESVDESSPHEVISLDELPEADQAVRNSAKSDSKQNKPEAKPKSKQGKKHDYSKDADKYFEDWPSTELKIPPDLERQLEALPDSWFKSPKSTKSAKNVKSFPIDPFLYEVDIPKCKFTQRIDSLTMIIQEKRIRTNLMEVKPFKNDDGLHIRLCSIAENECNKWFYIYVEFDSATKCSIERSSIRTDINELNCVILMKKSEGSRRLWPLIRLGPCKDTLSVVYLDKEAEVRKMNQDLFANYHSPHLPMHVVDPICTPEKMTLTLKPGRDPKDEEDDDDNDDQDSKDLANKKHKNGKEKGQSQKYSKTADEISALIQSGKIDEAIAKEIELEQEKELDELMLSKDEVATCSEKFDQDFESNLDQEEADSVYQLSETISKCRKLVSEKYFPKKELNLFAPEDGYMLQTLHDQIDDDELQSNNEKIEEQESPLCDDVNKQNVNSDQKSLELSKEDLSLELNPAFDADSEKKAEDDSSPRDSIPSAQQSKGGKQKQNESKSAKKKKKQQKNQQRARLMSHSSDDEQTRVNTYKNIENCKPVPTGGKSKKNVRNGSYDSSSTASPAQSPRVDEDNDKSAFQLPTSHARRTNSTGSAYSANEDDNPTYSSARPIIKRSCRSCAEQEDSDGEMDGSLRKSVSFCEDVDVVNIRTTTTKAARKSTKKMKKKDRRRNGSGGGGGEANSDDEAGDGEDNQGGQQQVEVREQATWNKIPLSTIPLTFDLD